MKAVCVTPVTDDRKHLLEKNGDGRTSSISSMKIEEYKEVEDANT